MKYNILQFGLGNVGKYFVQQLQAINGQLQKTYGLTLKYSGFFTSKGGVVIPERFSSKQITQLINQLQPNIDPHKFGQNYYANSMMFLNQAKESFFKNTLIIDTTTSSELYPFMEQAMKKGASLVIANKKLLTGALSEFQKLNSFGPKRLMHETTVGAGLPVINTLKSLLATGDEVIEISGCMSGTLGFICSSLEEGMLFSESVKKAKELGYTEFDPRADLSGQDVARKALILARILGQKTELTNLPVEPFYTKELADISIDEFMDKVHQLDKQYQEKMQKAQAQKKTLRYVASITKTKCSVGLQEVPKESNLGSLKGADNIFVFKTKRYSDRPLVIQGPGAGPEVTAAGVMADILSIAGVV